MERFLKSSWFFVMVLLVSVSLIGCGVNKEVSKETASSEKTSGVNEKKADSKDTIAASEAASTSNEGKESKQTETPVTQESKSEEPNTASSNTSSSVSSKPAAETKPSTASTQGASTTTPPKGTTSTTPAVSTPPKTQASAPVVTEKPAAAVTISIKGPKDRGTILASSKVEFKDGATIFDILLQIAKKQGILIESRGSGATTYVEGIDNIYEFDYGVKSGWVFKLNGVSLTKSIGTTKVKDGDTIECYYTE